MHHLNCARRRGCAFIEFEQHEHAEIATTHRGQMVGIGEKKRQLDVRWASRVERECPGKGKKTVPGM